VSGNDSFVLNELPISCPHCEVALAVHVRARTIGRTKTSNRPTVCPKCLNEFDAGLKDDILAGPFLPVFEDTWKKSLGGGIVTYTTTGVRGSGFNYEAIFERGSLLTAAGKRSTGQLTREEIENLFADFVAGNSGRVNTDKKRV
jgi:hypothetical protein